MGSTCYSVSKPKRHSIDTETNHSSIATTSTVDTQGYIETEARVLSSPSPKRSNCINYNRKPILRKLMERNKMKNKQ